MISSEENKMYKNNDSDNVQVHLTCLQTQTTNNSVQSLVQDRSPKFEVPVFNINIFLPSHETKSVTVHVPKITPIIHLHFDEIAKVLQLREEQNKDATYQIFQSLLSMTSSKLGDVNYNFVNEAVEEKIIDMVQTRSSSSKMCSVDEKSHTATNTVLNVSPKQSEVVTDCNEFTSKTLKGGLKLKKSAVILRDICKSKYYKNLIATANLNDSVSEDKETGTENVLERLGSVDSEEKICSDQEYDCDRCHVKMETESRTWESQRESPVIDENCSLVNTTCPQAGGVGNIGGIECEVSEVNRTLTALAEGCNFSEILKRFKLKQGVGVVDLGRSSENPDETEVCVKEEIICDDINGKKSDDDSSAMTEDFISETNCLDESSIKSTVQESVIEQICYEGESNNNPDCDNPLQSNDSCHLNSSSDSDTGNDVTPEEASSLSDIRVTNGSEVCYMSATNSSLLLPGNILKFHKNNLVDSLPLKIKQKTMKSPSESKASKEIFKNKSPKRGSLSSEASSVPKKMKRSKKERKTKSQGKRQPSSGLEGYIPLQASGPTKFSVAPLNKVTPYKTHEAKHFKSNMLFGNRVSRFSNTKVLQTYVMKKKAYKNQAS